MVQFPKQLILLELMRCHVQFILAQLSGLVQSTNTEEVHLCLQFVSV